MKINIWILILISSIIIGIIQFFIPWWAVTIILFLTGLVFFVNAGKSFLYGILTGLIVWPITAAYQEVGSHVSASEVIGNLLGGMPNLLVYLVTGLIGGIVYGLSATTGTFLRKLVI